MKTDIYGQPIYTEVEIQQILLRDPQYDIAQLRVSTLHEGAAQCDLGNRQLPLIDCGGGDNMYSIVEMDYRWQCKWWMPTHYAELDIERWCLDRATNEAQLQRIASELLLYNERGLQNMLRYMLYLVDTMREHGIIWGVGRGSCVSSYVLYIIGVHKIDSLWWDLPIDEFLK
jgi:DNA polymerase III alpha subunit